MAFNRNTPWGRADSIRNIGQGIFAVSTPSHGGLYVPDEFNVRPEFREWAARWSGSPNWFEEDCCWAAVAVEFPDRFDALQVKHARAIVARYFPDIDLGYLDAYTVSVDGALI